MPCETCEPFAQTREIRRPDDLSDAIREAKRLIETGVLEDHPGYDGMTWPMDEMSIEKPWPDIVWCHLICPNCGQLFRLSAETYRGRGGAWEAIES